MYPNLLNTPGLSSFAHAIDRERQQQLAKWGDQKHADGTGEAFAFAAIAARARCQAATLEGAVTWQHILDEEVREALAESDPAALRAELIQVAAVCAAWVHDIDRRPPPAGVPFTAAELAAGEADAAALEAEFPGEGDGPADQKYPCGITIYCDVCGTEARRDYVVSDDMDQAARFEVARVHLVTNEGWGRTQGMDFCPPCNAAAVPAQHGEG